MAFRTAALSLSVVGQGGPWEVRGDGESSSSLSPTKPRDSQDTLCSVDKETLLISLSSGCSSS